MAEDISPKGKAVVIHAYDGSDLKYIDWDTIEALKTALEKIDDLQGALDSVGTDELDVNVEASVLPTGAATETTLDEIMDRLGDETSPAAGTLAKLLTDILTAAQIIDGFALADNLIFGYYDRWNENLGETKSGDGTFSANTTAVPAGYIYILHNAFVRNEGGARGRAEIYVRDPPFLLFVAYDASPAQYEVVTCSGEWVLKEGDYVTVTQTLCLDGDLIRAGVWGYKMKIA